ncbi:hypothetical protein VNO77_23439 [Canavalia gladiata]|uniref:Uncharacterized protein n=1 Tax=Canavalia gladiata TaxID=3824 RepID=A0AAN9QBV2_CANGL
MDSLLEKDGTQRRNSTQILEHLLETEHETCAQANNKAEVVSLRLQSAQAKIDSFHQELTKFTVQRLKQERTKHNYCDRLLELKNPNKKAILALFEKCVLQKS